MKHAECSLRWMQEDEQCVRDLITCLSEFDSFPFNLFLSALCTLQSAIPASDKLIADFNSAYADINHFFLQNQVFSRNMNLSL